MSQYPTLESMGVTSVEDVIKYTIRHESDTDVLKIYYKRAKGSFLSRSKKFSFIRGVRSIPIESRNSKAFENLSNISPQLTQAIQELDLLQADLLEEEKLDPKAQIDVHMNHLEKVINDKLSEMQELVKKL
ncbi:MAG: DUF3461 family protein [Oceanospirillaceae bacterium]